MAGITRDGLDAEAERIYAVAGEDVSVGAAPAQLVRALLGSDSIRCVSEDWLRGGGTIARVGPRWRIYLRRGLAAESARFILLHELGHHCLGMGADEDLCDALAARLLAPRQAFLRATRELGVTRKDCAAENYAHLAEWFVCSHSFAAMRFAEVTGEPLVLLSQQRVRVRGTAFSWPSERALRELVRSSTPPGLRKSCLRDDPTRYALRIA